MKAVIITGATSGIGLATAKLFSKNHFFVYMIARDQKKLAETEKVILKSKGFICDLEKTETINSIFQNIIAHSLSHNHKIESLINNAGIYHRKSITDESIDSLQKMYNVNLIAPTILAKCFLEHLSESTSIDHINPSLVFISSTLGIKSTAHTSTYSASKAAIINLTHSLALEAAPMKVRVNCVSPGIVETPIHGFDKMNSDEYKKSVEFYNTLQPLKRIGKPEDIAAGVWYLCGPDSNWITGTNLIIDGGINLL